MFLSCSFFPIHCRSVAFTKFERDEIALSQNQLLGLFALAAPHAITGGPTAYGLRMHDQSERRISRIDWSKLGFTAGSIATNNLPTNAGPTSDVVRASLVGGTMTEGLRR
jgi:hypothetical protein